MLVIEKLSKRYGPVRALDGASLRARAGTVHALLGENGAGKSTLSRVLSGVIRSDAGTIEIEGEPVRLGSPAAARRAGIRSAFQELALIPDLTVAENLVFESPPISPLAHVRRRHARSLAREHLERLGVEKLLHIDVRRRVLELSLVERQLVEVARALLNAPRVLILDESTSAMPPAESAWVIEKAKEAAAAGAVVLFISHRLNEVRAVADELTIMRNGATVMQGATAELSDDAIIAAMLGRRMERLYPPRDRQPGPTVLEVDGLESGRVGPVSLQVRAGEIFGLGGLEGQGQRRLMLALAGVVPARGSITLEGRRLRLRSPADAAENGIMFVPEDRQREGLFLGASIRSNMSISALRQFARKLLGLIDARLELRAVGERAQSLKIPEGRLEHPVSSLSGGNQQKVVLGRVLLTNPKLLLLYDCTRGVDVGTKAEIFQVIAGLASEGVAVVMYASDLSETVNMCDRVAVFVEGRISGLLERESISEDAILRESVGSRRGPAIEEAAA